MPRPTLLLAILLLAACGDRAAAPGRPGGGGEPGPAEAPPTGTGEFDFEVTGDAVAGTRPPVRFTGDPAGVTVAVAAAPDPGAALDRLLGAGTADAPLPLADAFWEGTASLGEMLPPLRAGLYEVEARRGETRRRVTLVVSDLALVVKRSPSEILVLVADRTTGIPVPGARLDVRGPSGRREGTADPTGVWRATFDPGVEAFVLARDGERVGAARASAAPPAPRGPAIWLMADRAAARPGDRVRLAAVARAPEPGGWRPETAGDARFRVTDASGAVVATGALDPQGAGLATGQFVLPESTAGGPATVRVTLPDSAGEVRIEIAPEEPAAVVLSVQAPAEAVRGDPVPVRISGRYREGGPAAGVRVDYRAAPDRAGGATVLEGEGVLDATGRLSTRFEPPEPGRWLFVARTADPGAGAVRAAAIVEVAPAAVRIELRPESLHLGDGEPVRVRVTGGPGRVEGTARGGGTEVPFVVDPDASAEPVLTFPPPPPGPFEVAAEALDAEGRPARARAEVWVDGEGPGPAPTGIRVLPDRREYDPGDTARVLVLLPPEWEGATLLFTVEGAELGPHSVEAAPGRSHPVAFRIPARLGRRVRLAVAAVRGGRVGLAEETVRVTEGPRRLDLSLALRDADPARGIARFAAEVRDPAGAPVDATTVVQAGAAPPAGAGPAATFGGSEEVRVVTAAPGLAAGSAGAVPDAPDPGPDPAAGPPLFWRAGSLPSPDAPEIEVGLPPGPSAGKIRVRAVTADGRTASAEAVLPAGPPMDLRLLGPAALVAGDVAILRAVARNEGEEDVEARIRFETEGFLVLQGGEAAARIAAGGGVDEAALTGSARKAGVSSARAVLDLEPAALTAETSFPVRPRGRVRIDTAAGEVEQGRSPAFLEVRSGTAADQGRLEVVLTGGPVSVAVRAHEALAGAEAGDAEDVLGRILPGALAASILDGAGIDRPPELSDAADRVRDGLAELAARQEPGGGWGRWPDGGPDLAATARIVAGLADLREAGFEVDGALVEAAAARLRAAAGGPNGPDPDAAAAAARALQRTGSDPGEEIARLAADPGRLSPAGAADLLAALLDARLRARAVEVLGRLEREGRRDAAGRTSWGRDGAPAYGEDPVVATAAVVRALLRAPGEATAESADRGLRFLLDRRQGAGWGSPRRTAAAALAFLAAAGARGAAVAGERGVRIRIGDAIAGSLRLTEGDVAFRGARIEVPGSYLSPGRNRIAFETVGEGSLWYSLRLTAPVPEERIRPEERGIRVLRETREVRLADRGPAVLPLSRAVARGTLLLVTVTLSADRPRERVWITVPLPGGAVPVPGDPASIDPALARPPGTRARPAPDRVAFFLPVLPTGDVRLAFLARAACSGKFTALPAEATPADDPLTGGSSGEETLYVE